MRLSTGDVTLTYGQYRAILATNRNQADRETAFREFHGLYGSSVNTYASLYNGVLQRDLFFAESRGYKTTLEAALHGNNIPTAVVENLIETTKAGTDPLRRYHRLRKRVLGLDTYHAYDTTIPLVDFDRQYQYDDVLDWLTASVAPLGADYQKQMRQAVSGGWIDVYENPGKRSGAYSAPVYGVHPYMLLNYNDTLDAVFTLAHEMGHSMHTLLSHDHQPFVYAGYTIFVAEVPSTLSEALFLDYMLAHASDKRERVVLLQHAIDGIVSTFYTQVMFADFELQAHRLAEEGRPVTADGLGEIYFNLLKAYHGDALDYDELARLTWARIPHFFSTPYYVYQYATCFASSAQIMKQISSAPAGERQAAVDRYLTLLKAGGSDHPMALLQRAGVDLGQPEPVRAVVEQMETLVSRLEREISRVVEPPVGPSPSTSLRTEQARPLRRLLLPGNPQHRVRRARCTRPSPPSARQPPPAQPRRRSRCRSAATALSRRSSPLRRQSPACLPRAGTRRRCRSALACRRATDTSARRGPRFRAG